MMSRVEQWGTPWVDPKEVRMAVPMGIRTGSTLDSSKAARMAGSTGGRKGMAGVGSRGESWAASWDGMMGMHEAGGMGNFGAAWWARETVGSSVALVAGELVVQTAKTRALGSAAKWVASMDSVRVCVWVA